MPVIMGRKTFESLGSKPLNGRINIILTSKKEIVSSKNGLQLAANIEESIAKAESTDCNEVFVIGGGEIFKEFLSRADRIYITRVHANLEGDTYFPVIEPNEWKMISSNPFPADEKHKYAYDFQVWERK